MWSDLLSGMMLSLKPKVVLGSGYGVLSFASWALLVWVS